MSGLASTPMSDMSDDQVNDFNRQIIAEFRENEGRIGGPFEGASVLLLHHTGAKTGTERVNPLAYRPVDDGWAVFASKAGSTSNPDWYHNLKANPQVAIEVGTDTVPVTVTEAEGAEREAIWEAQKADVADFAAYEETAGSRQIPVMVLRRR